MKEAHALPYFSAYDVFIILERKRTDDLRTTDSRDGTIPINILHNTLIRIHKFVLERDVVCGCADRVLTRFTFVMSGYMLCLYVVLI